MCVWIPSTKRGVITLWHTGQHFDLLTGKLTDMTPRPYRGVDDVIRGGSSASKCGLLRRAPAMQRPPCRALPAQRGSLLITRMLRTAVGRLSARQPGRRRSLPRQCGLLCTSHARQSGPQCCNTRRLNGSGLATDCGARNARACWPYEKAAAQGARMVLPSCSKWGI